jgi:hypothetical protein
MYRNNGSGIFVATLCGGFSQLEKNIFTSAFISSLVTILKNTRLSA